MRRRSLLLAPVASLTIGLASVACAADLPIYTKAPIAPYYDWTGVYTGVDVGYAWKDPTITFSPNDPVSALLLAGTASGHPIGPISFTDKGAIGGFAVGYNWQIKRSWLIGVEADINAASIEGQGSTGSVFSFIHDGNHLQSQFINADQEILWFGTVRARAGWLPTNDLLLYGTGGFAYGRVSESVIDQNNGNTTISQSIGGFSVVCAAGATCYQGATDRIATGWTAGAGMEYHVPNSHASFKVEYLYVNLGAGDTVTAVAQNIVAGTTASSFAAKYSGTDFNTVKLGLNWKF
jgi:outer membrane immunogenic protein